MRLTRAVPYDEGQVRSVTLAQSGGRLFVEVTAEVPVKANDTDPTRVAGVDLGIIHPYALASRDEALLVSGRALRAESRLHLADTKARSSKSARRAPKKGQRGSRRWRKVRARQRLAEASHRRRISQAHHEAATEVISWALSRRIGTLVVGHPAGIAGRDAGRRQNLAVHNWRMAHLLQVLSDKAEVAGIGLVAVDERGTSSTCPECRSRTSKPKDTSPREAADPRALPRSSRTVAPAGTCQTGCGVTQGAPAWPREKVTGRPWPAPRISPGESLVKSSRLDEEPHTLAREGERL